MVEMIKNRVAIGGVVLTRFTLIKLYLVAGLQTASKYTPFNSTPSPWLGHEALNVLPIPTMTMEVEVKNMMWSGFLHTKSTFWPCGRAMEVKLASIPASRGKSNTWHPGSVSHFAVFTSPTHPYCKAKTTIKIGGSDLPFQLFVFFFIYWARVWEPVTSEAACVLN